MSEIDLLIQELRDTIDNQREEIDRLNNILDKLEKIFIEDDYQYLQRKLKELKKGDKDE